MNQPEGLYEAAGRRRGEQRFLIALGVIGLAITLILGAFFIGRVSAGDSPSAVEPRQQLEPGGEGDPDSLAEAALGTEPPQQKSQQKSEQKSEQKSGPTPEQGRLTGPPYRGPRAAITPRIARAKCQAPESVDAGGRRVSYSPMNSIDQRRSSAWRCNGNGRGQKVRFELPSRQQIVTVGLVPGYAKIDPVNGTDRYRENRRIKRVRWTFDGGRFVVQKLDHRPGNRSVQRLRIPSVETRAVTLTILGSTRARRNTVAISKAFFAAAR